MPDVVNIHEAKTHLSRLVDAAAKGDTFIIAKDGQALVKVVPVDAPSATEQKRLGFLEGALSVPDDFDSMGQTAIARQFGKAG